MEIGSNPIRDAFELARSGRFTNVEEIRRELARIGHSDLHRHLAGTGLRRQLAQICRSARAPNVESTESR